ncbi:Cof-type HAD-IIB family hydrolase [Simiduia sp. 21SJ11W-1]|uniref:HAD family hydrolase n=1 Tax=Simiduia sp. 21SJ11W-1 TaxID=2909669 RepID=UPI00209CC001|nr:HAD family hydrolase [Simiduia sp. 21SJ11W-1]UTA49245.1 Cof-type HAD-IIB family hydrolase [Simiduia sp. 21SJ11W-1]
MNTPFIHQLPCAGARPRLAFFDVDGTLLDREGRLSVATINAITSLQRAGVSTAFATGRPPFAVAHLQEQLQLTGPHVFYTGAHCQHGGTWLAQHRLTVAEWQPIALAAIAAGLHCEIYYDDKFCIAAPSSIAQEHGRHLGVHAEVLPFASWPKVPAYKLLLGAELTQHPEGLVSIEAHFGAQHFAYAHLPSRPQWQFASVVSGAVDKVALLKQLVSRIGCGLGEVVSFGDGGSDMDFLRTAGLGIAMGNAGLEVQQAASFVTRPSCQDGVAYAISHLLKRCPNGAQPLTTVEFE